MTNRLKFSKEPPIIMRKPKRDTTPRRDHVERSRAKGSMITPTAGAGPIHETQAVAPSSAPQPPSASAAAQVASVSLQAIPSSPPPEVLDQMAQASRTYEQLSAQGRTLHFGYDEAAGRASVEVRDRGGNVVGQLSLAQALDVAAGAPLQ